MREILDSVEPVVRCSRNVTINNDAIEQFTRSVTCDDFDGSEWDSDTLLNDVSEEEHVAFPFVYNTLNFCFWGDPKWTIELDGRQYDGSAALLRALRKGIMSGYPLLDSKYLQILSTSDLETVLKGNIAIPLFGERLRLLRSLGTAVEERFSGSFSTIIKKSGGRADDLVRLIVKEIPEVFDDTSMYRGRVVRFYKRAQLIPCHLFDLYRAGCTSLNITNFDELTAFADYKVPQLLRKFDILKYSKALAGRVDKMVEIPSGSEEEIEIRANTVWAVELATRILKQKYDKANAARVDGIFWFKGQQKCLGDKPYHRTRTIWY